MPRSSPPHAAAAALADRGDVAGLWSLVGGELSEIARFDIGPTIVLVPTEEVLLLTADLPLPGLRRRAEALPFAIEDRIAQPLGAVHIALGAELAPQRHLAGVVSHDVMRDWVATIDAAGLAQARIVPDALLLPIPAAGCWSVDRMGARALVRRDDGTGLALPIAHLAAAWAAAGRPRCIAYGAPLPDGMADSESTIAPIPADPALDLRHGAYALPHATIPRLARRLAMVAALGLVAHGAIAGLDTLALRHTAAKRAAETRALIAQVAPSAAIGDDVAASAADLLPANGSGASAFLPLLVRVGGALRQIGPAAALRSVAFNAQAGTIALQVETGDMASLQRVTPALAAQGLSAESGAASMSQGKAVGAFLVRSGS